MKKPFAPILDRIPQFDPKSKNFQMRTTATDTRIIKEANYRYIQLDQGQEGACVGHDVAMEAAAYPAPFFGSSLLPTTKKKAQAAAFKIYERARVLDGVDDTTWPSGTSLLAGCKAGVEAGYWDGYVWADQNNHQRAIKEIMLWLSYEGPVMLATNWYGSMFQATQVMSPLPGKAFRISGEIAGGHAYLLTRIKYMGPVYNGGTLNVLNWAVWTPNSWGGQGQGWLMGKDLLRLIAEDGEAAAPVVRH